MGPRLAYLWWLVLLLYCPPNYGVHKLLVGSDAAQSRVINLHRSAYTSMTESTTTAALPAAMTEMREMTSTSATPPTVPMLMHPQRIPGPSPHADRVLDPPPLPKPAFAFSDFLRKEYRFGMDTSRRRICAFFVQGHCPMGNSCPDKHTVSSSFSNLVCKHWLRGLCKKGDGCEFLHEYNLFPPPSSLPSHPPSAFHRFVLTSGNRRKMPECNFYVRNGYCSNGEECLYLHVDPDSKIPRCPHYDNGFCPLGQACTKRHVRMPEVCRFFLAGFCPSGRACNEGAHPKWVPPFMLAPPIVRRHREDVVTEVVPGPGPGPGPLRETGPPHPRDRERERDRERDRDGSAREEREQFGGGRHGLGHSHGHRHGHGHGHGYGGGGGGGYGRRRHHGRRDRQ